MFSIKVDNLHWLDKVKENEDLCLHGYATVTIGKEIFEYNATVSSTALYLLKSLKKDHLISESSNQMLPCCGHFIIPDDTLSSVEIIGCNNGIDWTVRHENNNIVLITKDGNKTEIAFDLYQKTVFGFADEIEAFYKNSKEKSFANKFEKDGYTAFWKEWHQLRGNQY